MAPKSRFNGSKAACQAEDSLVNNANVVPGTSHESSVELTEQPMGRPTFTRLSVSLASFAERATWTTMHSMVGETKTYQGRSEKVAG